MDCLVAGMPRQEAERDDVPRIVHTSTTHTDIVPTEQAMMQGSELVIAATEPAVMLVSLMNLVPDPLRDRESLSLGVNHPSLAPGSRRHKWRRACLPRAPAT